MSSPEGRQPAPLWRRLIARLLDDTVTLVLMGIPVGAAAGSVILMAWGVGDDFLMDEQSSTDWIWFVLLIAIVLATPLCMLSAYFLYQIFAGRHSGQTSAKRWFGTRVVRNAFGDSAPVSVNRLLSRCAVLHGPASACVIAGLLRWPAGDRRLVFGGLGWLLVAALPTVWSRSGRGVHDWAAGTAVVRACARPSVGAELADAAGGSASAIPGSANGGAV